MENHIDHPLTVTVEQAAKLLGIGRSTAYELVHTGDLPSLRLGRRIVVPRCQIATMLGAETTDMATTPPLGAADGPVRAKRPTAAALDDAPTLF